MRREIRCQRAAQGVSALVALAATFTATGCSDPSSENRPGDSVGSPNPAAVFCQEQGGDYSFETGECRLTDGTAKDAWEYFRENAEPGAPD
jgi:putative hemolysin